MGDLTPYVTRSRLLLQRLHLDEVAWEILAELVKARALAHLLSEPEPATSGQRIHPIMRASGRTRLAVNGCQFGSETHHYFPDREICG